MSLGYADNTALGRETFAGQDVDASSLLVGFTYRGDSDLDGDVDIDDLSRLASSWHGAGVWTDGDFDYNGMVDANDLAMLASNWQAGASNSLNSDLLAAVARVGLSAALVPEPTLPLCLGIAASLLCRPRRQSGGETVAIPGVI
jgi:hypothetical protein